MCVSIFVGVSKANPLQSCDDFGPRQIACIQHVSKTCWMCGNPAVAGRRDCTSFLRAKEWTPLPMKKVSESSLANCFMWFDWYQYFYLDQHDLIYKCEITHRFQRLCWKNRSQFGAQNLLTMAFPGMIWKSWLLMASCLYNKPTWDFSEHETCSEMVIICIYMWLLSTKAETSTVSSLFETAVITR